MASQFGIERGSMRLPGPFDHRSRITAAAGRLAPRLLAATVREPDFSAYFVRYLRGLLPAVDLMIERYAGILAGALSAHPDPDACTFVDFGGGNGLLSLLARAAGVGRVVYGDIDENTCRDAHALGRLLALEADAYLSGDVAALRAELEGGPPGPVAVGSYDVIEHVYDLAAGLAELARIPASRLSLMHASSANAANPFVRLKLERHHRRVEHQERTPQWGDKGRDSNRAYADLRRDMIRSALPGLEGARLEQAVDATRGSAGGDVAAVARRFVESGQRPAPDRFASNTCDPRTGNWAERLMDHDDLRRWALSCGFARVDILPGRYGRYPGRLKSVVGGVLNLGIEALPRAQAVRLAPYFALYAER